MDPRLFSYQRRYCKEVVIPDKKGKPVGGLTCGSFKVGQQPPGYEPWDRPGQPDDGIVVAIDADQAVELTRDDVRALVAMAIERWGDL